MLQGIIFVIKDENSEKPHKFMFFKGVKFEKLNNSDDPNIKDTFQCFCLIFCQNKTYSILYTPTTEDFDNWVDKICGVAVLSGFNKCFKNIKVVGKGTFAKVLMSQRLSDGKNFAVKTFDKSALEKNGSTSRNKVKKFKKGGFEERDQHNEGDGTSKYH